MRIKFRPVWVFGSSGIPKLPARTYPKLQISAPVRSLAKTSPKLGLCKDLDNPAGIDLPLWQRSHIQVWVKSSPYGRAQLAYADCYLPIAFPSPKPFKET